MGGGGQALIPSRSGKAWKWLLAAAGGCAVFFLALVRPIHNQNADLRRQNEALEQAIQRAEQNLRIMAPLPESEKRLWPFIAHRVESVLREEDDLIGAVASLVATIQEAGANVVSVAIDGSPPPDARQAAPRRPQPTARPEAGEDLAEAAELLRGRTLDRPSPRVAERPAPFAPRRPGRNARAEEAGGGLPDIGRPMRAHTVVVEAAGSYMAWTEAFNRLSAQLEPVLIKKIEVAPGGGDRRMKLTVAVPVLAPGEAAPEPPGEAVAVAPETKRLYHLARLREPLSPPFPSALGDPFPPRETARAPGDGLPQPTTILWRDGVPAAVFGRKIVGVGGTVNGRRIVDIRDNTVYFAD